MDKLLNMARITPLLRFGRTPVVGIAGQISRVRLFDLVVCTALMVLVLRWCATGWTDPPDAPRRTALLLLLLIWPTAVVVTLSWFGTYGRVRIRKLAVSLLVLAAGVGASFVVLAVALRFLDRRDMSLLLGSVQWLLLPFLMAAIARIGIVWLNYVHVARATIWPHYALVGEGPGLQAAAAVLGSSLPGCAAGTFAPQAEDELARQVRQGAVDQVVLIREALSQAEEQRLLEKLLPLAVNVSIYRGVSNQLVGALPHIEQVLRRPGAGWRAVVKDGTDRLAAILLLALLMPLLLALAAAVKLTSAGPALFRQKRHGLRNEEILVFKFRTMRTDLADYSGRLQTQRNDSRITPLGRFLRVSSFDELPQLLNVARGEMSLVGPRPHPIDMRTEGFLGSEISEHYDWRHRVKPGLTGWAQINGSRGATVRREQVVERIRLDNYYIENWSLSLDLKIMIRTGLSLFKNENAF